MNILREYIRERLIKENIQAAGMCFPFAYQKAEEWFEKYFTPGGRGRKPKRHPDLNDKSKFKVVHGTVTDKWKNPPKPVVHGWVEMGDLVFDDQTKITKPNGVDKEFYYDMYQPEVYKEFTAEEAVVNCIMKGGEGPWDDDLYAQMQDRDAWMKESRVREYVRALLKEDPMGFVHDLATSTKGGEFGEDFFGGEIGKSGGKAIKRAFAKNADHQWLSTLGTVHWTSDAYGLTELIGGSKDELSTTISLPGGKLDPHGRGGDVGLWVKGRITLAANNQDKLFTGAWHDYMGAQGEGTPEEQEHRQKSSGVNKRPTISKDYSRYDSLKSGNEFHEKMARNIPYVLDQSTWNPEGEFQPNEALVDNWSAIGIVVAAKDLVKFVKHYAENDPSQAIGAMKELFKAATDFGIPIYDVNRTKLWGPDEAS